MKKIILIALVLCVSQGIAQKKKNGTIYLEHPAIDMVNDMLAAMVAGDHEKVASYLAEDFRSFNGSSRNPDAKGRDKEWFVNSVKWMKDNLSYLSLEPSPGAYPDALEYKDGDVWVQTWNQFKGMHNETGVKLNSPFHRMVKFNADNKISMIINYSNDRVWLEVNRSYGKRTNGTLYNHHDYINSVRIMMNAFENKDMDKAYSFFHEDARFNSLESPVGETWSLEQVKERNKQMMEAYDVTSIDVVGYPDALEYEIGGGGITVQSWWNFRMTRKSDGKKFVLPAMYTHDFDDDGKIVRSNAYVSTKVLDAK